MVDINDWSRFPGDDVKSPEVAADLSFGLFYRLLDDRNQVLRAFVREITFEVSKSYSELKQKLEQPQDLLAVLVKALPNLEAV